jgi:hypothetical protein
LFGVLLNKIEYMPFAIVVERGILPAVSGLVQPVRESRLDRESWTIESPVRALPELGTF